MTPHEMQRFLESRLNYERRGMPAQQELRIDRVAALLERLGQPQSCYPIVHIAGSKGKGSTAHMVAAILTATGGKVGLHTSPHFIRLEERFRVNGIEADPFEIAQLTEELIPLVAEVDRKLKPAQPELTFFEITTALFLLYFKREQVDWAVVEVGMGGRLDSTNVVLPEVSVITSISRDHMRQLGDTLEKIAAEKAGIIKPMRPVVVGKVTDSVRKVIEEIARSQQSPAFFLGEHFHVEHESDGIGIQVQIDTWLQRWPAIQLNMLGAHQADNAAVAAAAIDVLRQRGLELDLHRAQSQLNELRLPGRIEILSTDPLVIVDVAHNDASAAALRSTLNALVASRYSSPPKRILIYGTSADKEWQAILTSLASDYDHVILTTFISNPRGVPPAELANGLPESMRPKVTTAEKPTDAWQVAQTLLRSAASPSDPAMICITGSFYLVAELRTLMDTQSTFLLSNAPGNSIASP